MRNYTAMLLFCTVGCAQLSTHTPAGRTGDLPSHIVQCEKTHRFTGARRQGIGK